MFDIGWPEMMVIGVVALLIIGPKDLPRVFKQVSQWIRYARGMANEFRSGVDDMVREADLEDAKKMFDSASELNPKNQIKNLIDPDQTLAEDLDFDGELGDAFPTEESKIFKYGDAKSTGLDPSPTPAAKKKTAPKKNAGKKSAAKKTTTAKKPATKKPATKKVVAKKATKTET